MAIGALNVGVSEILTASGNVMNRPGAMIGILISSYSATPTFAIYDSATNTTTTKLVDTVTVNGGTPEWVPIPITFSQGCYIVINGTMTMTVVVSG